MHKMNLDLPHIMSNHFVQNIEQLDLFVFLMSNIVIYFHTSKVMIGKFSINIIRTLTNTSSNANIEKFNIWFFGTLESTKPFGMSSG